MYIPNQELIGSFTYSEMLETMDFLAENKEEREKAEQEMTNELPKGFSVGIDYFGIINIMSPLQVHKVIH